MEKVITQDPLHSAMWSEICHFTNARQSELHKDLLLGLVVNLWHTQLCNNQIIQRFIG
jgi:hypothetical protein